MEEESALKAQLEDCQASLAAALGRIEAFRMRERQTMNELSALRQQVHNPDPNAAAGAIERAQSSGPKPAAAFPAGAPQPAPVPLERSASRQQAQTPEGPAPAWVSPSGQPVYVSNVDGEYPVHLINGSKKVPGSLVVTKDFIDFVESRARIRQEDFVGISTVKGSEPSTSGTDEDGNATGVWQMIWSRGGVPQRQAFEATVSTREALHRHTQRWLGEEPEEAPQPKGTKVEGSDIEIAVPRHLSVGDPTLMMVGEPSLILTSEDLRRSLASAMPPLERLKEWALSYSTSKHGISLQTLYRKAHHGLPTILLVKDFGGYSFGVYTSDSWHVAPRYYGSGETFVFQLEPYRVAYPWRSLSTSKNDFFQFSTNECLAVGGLGHFAVWLDEELLQGSSGLCGTFGSPCLASAEEFRVQHVEMWQPTS